MTTKMTACVHCGDNAVTTNDDGQPTCNEHRDDDAKTVDCPGCGKPMQVRDGQYGYFWGCTDYPECQVTQQLSDVAD